MKIHTLIPLLALTGLLACQSAPKEEPAPVKEPAPIVKKKPPYNTARLHKLVDSPAVTYHLLAERFDNSLINYEGYMKDAMAIARHRQVRRLNEEDFIKMSKEENTIILDTRSKAKFKILHIKGAKHLNFADFNKNHWPRSSLTKTQRY